MKWLILGMMFISSPSFAMLTSDLSPCDDEFTASVKEIVEPVGSLSGFSKEKVIFDNDRSVDILMNGPFQLEQGKEYHVKMREGRVCWIESA